MCVCVGGGGGGVILPFFLFLPLSEALQWVSMLPYQKFFPLKADHVLKGLLLARKKEVT